MPKPREIVLAKRGIDAIKLVPYETGRLALLKVGQWAFHQYNSMFVTPASARRIAARLVKWAASEEAKRARCSLNSRN